MNLETFKTFIKNNQNKLYRFALSITKDPATAQDVVQEVFIKIWNQIQKVEIENPVAWAVRLTRNLSIDKTRLKSRSFDSLGIASGIQNQTSDPMQQTMEKDAVNKIHQFIEELPAKQRNIIHLREIEEMTYDEISEVLELPIEQVKVYLYRARKVIRQKYLKINAYGI
jgi:RNA polymerase sigma-70 factor (ECF subfamily)